MEDGLRPAHSRQPMRRIRHCPPARSAWPASSPTNPTAAHAAHACPVHHRTCMPQRHAPSHPPAHPPNRVLLGLLAAGPRAALAGRRCAALPAAAGLRLCLHRQRQLQAQMGQAAGRQGMSRHIDQCREAAQWARSQALTPHRRPRCFPGEPVQALPEPPPTVFLPRAASSAFRRCVSATQPPGRSSTSR